MPPPLTLCSGMQEGQASAPAPGLVLVGFLGPSGVEGESLPGPQAGFLPGGPVLSAGFGLGNGFPPGGASSSPPRGGRCGLDSLETAPCSLEKGAFRPSGYFWGCLGGIWAGNAPSWGRGGGSLGALVRMQVLGAPGPLLFEGGRGGVWTQGPGLLGNRPRFPETGLICRSGCWGAGPGFRAGFAPVPGRDAGPRGGARPIVWRSFLKSCCFHSSPVWAARLVVGEWC